jgi:hypothetical protein
MLLLSHLLVINEELFDCIQATYAVKGAARSLLGQRIDVLYLCTSAGELL